METYERIKHLRKNVLGMSREKFGATLGTNYNVINNIERNRLANPEQKEPLYRLICKEFNVNYDWLMSGEGEMFVIAESDAKAEAIRQLTEAFNLDSSDVVWLNILLKLKPEEKKGLKALAVRVAEAAAAFSDDVEMAQEMVADAMQAEEEYRAEWNKGLTIKEQADLLRARADALEKGNVLSTTYEKARYGTSG